MEMNEMNLNVKAKIMQHLEDMVVTFYNLGCGHGFLHMTHNPQNEQSNHS